MSDSDIPKSKRHKLAKIDITQKLTEANRLFVRNDFSNCITILKNVLKKSPKNSKAYFMLGLVFEEMKDDIKAYNFYLVASQLMRTNFGLWQKLFELSTKLNLLTDKLYFIEILQKHSNTRELVAEKFKICKILKKKYKILEVMIEFFYFDGVDFKIFEKIKQETKHKLRTAVCANMLIKYFKKNVYKCGMEFLMNIIRLQFDTGYFFGTRNLIEDYLIQNKIDLPNDIRLIYMICNLMNNEDFVKFKENEQTNEEQFYNYEIKSCQNTNNFENNEDLKICDNINDEYFKTDNFENFDLLNEDLCENQDRSDETNGYKLISEKIFNSKESIFANLNIENDDMRYEVTQTLNLSEFLTGKSSNTEDELDKLIKDQNFWKTFEETEILNSLLEILDTLNMNDKYFLIIQNLEKFTKFEEFFLEKYGYFYYKTKNYDMTVYYYQRLLGINPDNNKIKTKLYEIYVHFGNTDLADKFKTISKLIHYIDDVKSDEKSKHYSVEKCNEFRDVYLKCKNLFDYDINQFLKESNFLVEDFINNKYIFSTLKKTNIIFKEDTRPKSLHGLNSDEWAGILIDFILANITLNNFSEVSYLLKKCLSCEIFRKKKVYYKFVFLTIKHSIHLNDLKLLQFCFSKVFITFYDYNWANFYFYLLNFFSNYNSKRSYTNILRNIRRVFKRNNIYIKKYKNYKSLNVENNKNDLETKNKLDNNINFLDYNNNSNKIISLSQEINMHNISETKITTYQEKFSKYKSLTLNLLLGSFFTKSISPKSYKLINNIILDGNLKNKLIYNLILIITFKCRINENKNEMLKEGLNGLKNLLNICSNQEFFMVSYNIGVVYHMLGYVGFAEKYYKECLLSKNMELKRLARLNLLIIYKKNNPFCFKKYFEEDDFC